VYYGRKDFCYIKSFPTDIKIFQNIATTNDVAMANASINSNPRGVIRDVLRRFRTVSDIVPLTQECVKFVKGNVLAV
jgi:hypothetical protein